MKYEEAKTKFIHSWGVLGSAWGINKTMAQIHALLLISAKSLTTDEIIAALGISRGNVSMSLKSLMDWGIVFKDYKAGDRKDYFYTTKDVWDLATQVARERQRRELAPVIRMLKEVQECELDEKDTAQKEFKVVTKDLTKYAKHADKILKRFVAMESNWFFSKFLKFFK